MRIPKSPPSFKKLVTGLASPEKLNVIFQAVGDSNVEQRYLHWDELRFRKPPKGLTHEDWWFGLKLSRRTGQKTIPLKDKHGRGFHFTVPDLVTDLLHQIDRGGGTFVQVPEQVTNAEQRDRYVVRSLMEEAITSSQLEGAATTREVAKKMLTDGRKPKDRSERMIVNNYVTMRHILKLKDKPMTPDVVFQIHEEISVGVLDNPDGAGRFRSADESINVSDKEGKVFHPLLPPGNCLPDSKPCVISPTAKHLALLSTPLFVESSFISGWLMITRLWTATVGRPGRCSTGRCSTPATGSSSSFPFHSFCEKPR